MVTGASDRFEELVAGAADPDRVRVVVDRLGNRATAAAPETVRAIVAVAGASDSLGALLVEDPRALGVLDDLTQPAPLDGADPQALRASHRRALLRIAARDLLGDLDLEGTMTALSALAVELVERALDLADAADLAVVGMGKFGAGELNFVSDVDIVFVSEDDTDAAQRAARRFLDVAGRCVRVDVGLRPEGRDGPLVRSVAAYRTHWERWAAPWEFQALLKAASVAGPTDLRRSFDDAAAEALWTRAFGTEDLHEIRRLKARAEEELRHRGVAEREVKRGPGGIRDIEFSVQLLQLVHGGSDPALRVRSTIAAMERLVDGGYVDPDEAATLERAYRFLRTVEHRLQLVNEQQTHLVPDDRAARRRLARTLGYHGTGEGGPTELFDRDLSVHRLAVRRVHEGWYFRPLLDAFASAPPLGFDGTDMTATRLGAFGFRDATRTRQAVAELSKGLTRSSALMRQLLPLVLDWLSGGPDPDLGLLGLRRLATGEQRAMALASTFRDSAETARQLCLLLSTAPVATEILEVNPDLVERLGDVTRLQTADRAELLDSAWRSVGWREEPAEQQLALRRWYRRHLLGIIARDVAGSSDGATVGVDLSALVEAAVETAVRLVGPPVPFTVIALGRLGGRELSYASDVDLVFVDDGGDREVIERAAAEVLRFLDGSTPATRIVAVDADLRPEGRDGPLSRSLDSHGAYLDRWADVWERQALLKARPIAGSVEVGRAFVGLVDRFVRQRPPDDDGAREIRRMKARIEAERLGPALTGGVEAWRHLKLGPGGLADVEWTVQLLQWCAGIRARSTVAALDDLVGAGVVDVQDAAVFRDAHAWCDQVRNRAWLCLGQGTVLPGAVEPARVLARALDCTPVELVERHRRTMRRSRRVVERLFYQVG